MNLFKSIQQNTKEAFTIYVKFNFLEDNTILKTNAAEALRVLEEEQTNERIILKSADVTLCQNQQCNDEESFVNQFLNLNLKIEKTIQEKIEIIEPEKGEEVKEDDLKEEEAKEKKDKDKNKSYAWVAAPVIGAVVIGIIVFIIIDYKKHILFFKDKHMPIISSESVNNKVDLHTPRKENNNSQ